MPTWLCISIFALVKRAKLNGSLIGHQPMTCCGNFFIRLASKPIYMKSAWSCGARESHLLYSFSEAKTVAKFNELASKVCHQN